MRLAGLAAILSCARPAVAEDPSHSAGFIAIEESTGVPEAGLWYPSVSDESERSIGPFRATWAWDGATATGKFPVIVLSHGYGGRWINHRDTAAALARRGFIVIAPLHAHDNNPDASPRARLVSSIATRTREIASALDVAQKHPKTRDIADAERTGALGYSRGTISALAATGATPSISLMISHCDAHGSEDAAFCYGDSWIARALAKVKGGILWLKEKGVLKPGQQPVPAGEEFLPADKPVDFRAIALVAPAGALFDAPALQGLSADVAIFRLSDDDLLKSPYHAEHLRDELGPKARTYKTFEGVHHYAFISPFPAQLLELLEKEGVPVGADPEGFDRAAFIAEINEDLVGFFTASMSD